jgi:hypothetical protein
MYAFFIGRLGGTAFEDKPWLGFLVAFGGTAVISGLIEAGRRIRAYVKARQAAPDGAGSTDSAANAGPPEQANETPQSAAEKHGS